MRSATLAGLATLCLAAAAAPMARASPHTPAPGSAERKAIFDAMRTLGDNHTRVFVVRYLKVEDGWAWMTGAPQSPDGANHYEPESALLHKLGGVWQVIDQPCAEDGCDPAKELARIRAANPSAPAAIFPH